MFVITKLTRWTWISKNLHTFKIITFNPECVCVCSHTVSDQTIIWVNTNTLLIISFIRGTWTSSRYRVSFITDINVKEFYQWQHLLSFVSDINEAVQAVLFVVICLFRQTDQQQLMMWAKVLMTDMFLMLPDLFIFVTKPNLMQAVATTLR